MKCSELIKEVERVQSEYGDIECECRIYDGCGGYWSDDVMRVYYFEEFNTCVIE